MGDTSGDEKREEGIVSSRKVSVRAIIEWSEEVRNWVRREILDNVAQPRILERRKLRENKEEEEDG